MSSQRQRQSRWRVSLVLLVFFGLIRSGELAPARISSETSSTMSPFKRKSQDIGSLSDFTWQAWLLVDTQAGIQPGIDSTTLLRRITPKSVFIAPALPACAEGYRADAMGRCVKSVNIDENAHINFLLERLNALYANQDSTAQAAASKNNDKKSTGPLQLNIPLISDSNVQSTKIEHAFSMNDPMIVPAHNKTQPREDEGTKSHETMTAYQVKNDTTLGKDDEKTMFVLGNSSASNADDPERKADAMVVAEFVDETNDTHYSEVVDYKIPIDLKTLLNTSNVKELDVSDVAGEGTSTEKRWNNSTELSPTLVLLLSPTKLPSVVPSHTAVNDNITILALTRPHNATIDHAPVSDLTLNNSTIEDIVTPNATDSTYSLTKKLPEVSQPIIVDEQVLNNETHAEEESTMATTTVKNSSLKESQDTEFIYDEEEEDVEYTYSTDVPEEEEDSTEMEGEEILKHGEAGMTFPTRNVERLHRDQQRMQQQQPDETGTDRKMMLDTLDQQVIRSNDSTLAEDRDETGSNVSSEVSIDGDLILETTLLDVNTESLPITTKSPDMTRKAVESSRNEDFKESFDKNPVSEPEVVFSQDAHGTISTGVHGRKHAEHFTRIDEENEKMEVAPLSVESILSSDHPKEASATDYEIDTIDRKQSNTKDSAERERPENFQADVSANTPTRSTTNFDATDDYANFPGYVRFPSSEANSIHSLSYKQHSVYPSDDLGSYDSTSTKSSVPVRQKPVYYLATPSWKPDRPQSDRVPATATSERQKQSPMLLRFWSKMPLVRDPAIYPVDQIPDGEAIDDVRKPPRDRFLRTLPSRRADSYVESTPRSINRLLAQKRRTPIDG